MEGQYNPYRDTNNTFENVSYATPFLLDELTQENIYRIPQRSWEPNYYNIDFERNQYVTDVLDNLGYSYDTTMTEIAYANQEDQIELANDFIEQYNGEDKMTALSDVTRLLLQTIDQDEYKLIANYEVIENPFETYTITLTQNFLNNIYDFGKRMEDPSSGSDPIWSGGNISWLEIETIPRSDKMEGAFLPYVHEFHFDFRRYQLYRTNQTKDVNKQGNCFIHALILAGVNVSESQLVNLISTKTLPTSKIGKVANELGIRIKLIYEQNTTGSRKTMIYGKEGDVYSICYMKNHYFVYDPETIYHAATIKYYNHFREHPRLMEITSIDRRTNRPRYRPCAKLDSYKLMKLVLEQVKPMPDHNLCDFYQANKEDIELNPDNDAIKMGEFKHKQMTYERWIEVEEELEGGKIIKKNKLVKEPVKFIVFADTETTTYSKLKAYCVSWCVYNMEENSLNTEEAVVPFDKDSKTVPGGYWAYYKDGYLYGRKPIIYHSYGKDCIRTFLDSMPFGARIMFHNVKFDFGVINGYINNPKTCMKDGQIYSITGNYKNNTLSFVDSYKLISKPLAVFPNMFKTVNGVKEAYPYEYYNNCAPTKIKDVKFYNYQLRLINDLHGDNDAYKRDQLKKDKRELKKTFVQNATALQGCSKNEIFDYKKYAKFYCNKDVEILAMGVVEFWEFLKVNHDIDARHYLTISSIADAAMWKAGAYEDVYELTGGTRAFVQEAVVGGKVMTNRNQKWHYKSDGTDVICDIDVNSEYPASQHEFNGYPIGKPQLITNFQDVKASGKYYVAKFIITPHKDLDFPILPLKDKKGNRNFSNEKGECIVDKYTLEDLIEFAEADYIFVEGIWWPLGYNPVVKDEIYRWYSIRKELKKAKNPQEGVEKLMMNSSYGKNALKASKSVIVVKDGYDNYMKYLRKNFGVIEHITKVDMGHTNRYFISEIRPIYKHVNRVHLATGVLSYSKRIIGRMMYLAQDIGVKLYGMDTDSAICTLDGLRKLAKAFEEKYDKPMLTGELGDLSSDFKSSIITKGKCIAGEEYYALGKKAYGIKLRGYEQEGVDEYNVPILKKDENGKVMHDDTVDYHLRLKGVSAPALEANDYPMNTYKKLYEGESIEFKLSDSKPMFKFSNFDVSAVKKGSFTRVVKFI